MSEQSDSQPGQGPIFICGPSRSGTAMVRAALNLHPLVHLSGETHYFDDLRVALGTGGDGPLTPEQVEQCEEYLLALGHRPYSHGGDPDKGRVSREDFRARVAELAGGKAPTADQCLRAYCELEARHHGKTIWGEKTPRHIFRIDDILSAFPDARVICMIRDPRAVVASYRDWKNQGGFDFEKDPGHKETLEADHQRAKKSYHPIIIASLWNGAMRSALAAEERFGKDRVRLERFEDVVGDPDTEMRALLEWLALPFDPAVLDMPMSNSSYEKFTEGRGVSKQPVDRWKSKLAPGEIAVIQRVSGKVIDRLGYERMRGASLGSSLKHYASFPMAVVRAFQANRARMGNPMKFLWRRLRPMLGS
ncbi:MAG: sulfotransferase family protein [Phycisphaerales bacterium JB064]